MSKEMHWVCDWCGKDTPAPSIDSTPDGWGYCNGDMVCPDCGAACTAAVEECKAKRRA